MIRLVCVGLGGMGHHDWNAAIDTGKFEAVAGVDLQEQACGVFSEKTSAPTYDNLTSALAVTTADVALIATPDRFHAQLTLEALDAGLDVICEKPMAETLSDAAAMHFRALERGRMLMVHHQLRWHASHYQAHRMVESGAIGKIRRVDFHFSVHSDVCLRGYRSELTHLILQDLAIHHFDLIRYHTSQECEKLYVRDWPSPEADLSITAATDAVAVLEMTGPVTVNYTASIRELLDPVGYSCRVTLHGSEGQLSLDDQCIRFQSRSAHRDGVEPKILKPQKPEVDAWSAFAEAIVSREPALTDSGDNLHSLAMLFAAIESAESGQIVKPVTAFTSLA